MTEGNKTTDVNNKNEAPPKSKETSNSEPLTEAGTFWNGFKKVLGFPYEEADKYPDQSVKSVAERGLWGLWTYNEKSYGKLGELQENRNFKGNEECLREGFHENGALKYRADMKDGHPVGRVFHYGQHGQLEKEENFNQNGELDGIQKDNIQGRETNYSNGQKNGEEIYYDVSGKPLRSASYKNGELHGKSMNYENGDFEYYKNGEQYGPFQKTIQRNFEKIVSSGRVTNGKHLVTDRMTYSSDGKILHEEHFNENGNRHGLERYPEQGREIPWNDGERDGVEVDGTNIKTWKNDKLEGLYVQTSLNHKQGDDNSNSTSLSRTEVGSYTPDGKKVTSESYSEVTLAGDKIASRDLTKQEYQDEVNKRFPENSKEERPTLKDTLSKKEQRVETLQMPQTNTTSVEPATAATILKSGQSR